MADQKIIVDDFLDSDFKVGDPATIRDVYFGT